jgi:phage baseplate assembly protein V
VNTFDALTRLVRKMMAPLSRKVENMVARGVIRLVDDNLKTQTAQVDLLADETSESVERLQQYGFTSVPKNGTQCVVVFVGGRRSHGVIVATDAAGERLNDLDDGDVALYSSGANLIHLMDNGDLLISAPDGHVRIEGKTVTIHADDEAILDAGGTGVKFEPGEFKKYGGAGEEDLPATPPEIV